jgi:hypothetical protein
LFTVKEGSDDRVFLLKEGTPLLVELERPTDLRRAKEVADFLNEHIKAMRLDPKVAPPGSGLKERIDIF